MVHKHTSYSVRVDVLLINVSTQKTYESRFNTQMERCFFKTLEVSRGREAKHSAKPNKFGTKLFLILRLHISSKFFLF